MCEWWVKISWGYEEQIEHVVAGMDREGDNSVAPYETCAVFQPFLQLGVNELKVLNFLKN